MKNIFKKAIIFSVVATVLCAETKCCAIDFIPDGQQYTISGNAGRILSNMLSVNVEGDKSLAHKSYILTDDDGNFSYSFMLPDGIVAGKYTVKLTDSDKGVVYSHDFVYADENKKLQIIKGLNDATERNEAESALNECIEYSMYAYPTSFVISSEILCSVYDGISQISNFDLENLSDKLKEIFAVASLGCATQENIDKILTEYNQVYKFENEKYYSLYSTYDDVDAVNKKFLKNDFDNLSRIREVFNEITVLHKMCSEESPGGIAEVIGDFSDVFPASVINLSYSDKLSLGTFLLGKTVDTMTEMETAVSDMKNDDEPESSKNTSGTSDRRSSKASKSSSFAGSVASAGNGANGDKLKYAFADLRDAEWAREAVYALSNKEIINGYADGDFKPNNNITREEFVKIIVCAFKLDSVSMQNRFIDVPRGHWAEGCISSAFESGIVKGDESGAFGLGQNITRQDMAVIIYNALVLSGKAEAFESCEAFSDTESIADYALKAVNALKAYGISNGYTDGAFMPLNNATRAEAVQMIYKVMQFANLI